MMRLFVVLLVCASDLAFGSNAQTVLLAEVAKNAVEQSKLTSLGSAPFHLKATILETTNPDSDYKAEIEEFWISPTKYRRTIESPSFSQTLIVNGNKVSEQNAGDYFPWWLSDLITAIFDPHGLLESAILPGYSAEFKDYRDFNTKKVARRVVINPEPGTTIEAAVTEISDITNPDETLFTIQQASPPAEHIGSITVSEATARTLFSNTPDIVWPPVRSGKTDGVLSIYISVDRSGRVREAWPLSSDNAGLEDAAREQVMKWQFKPAKTEDGPVQVQTALTFAFHTKIGDPITILSDAQARSLATSVVEPRFPPDSLKGTEVKIQVGVSLDGTVNGVSNPHNVPTPLFMAAYGAVIHWHFSPYLRDGKPDPFGADIVFRVP